MPKRKRIVLSMRDKCEINKRLEEGESASKLCNEYNIGRSTITSIKQHKTIITNYISKLDSINGSNYRKTMKLAMNADLDDAVYKWYTQKKSQGEYISGPVLCEKAIQINKEIKGPLNFKASSGWLTRFKSRHGICENQIHGETQSDDSSVATSFNIELRDVLKEEVYTYENSAHDGEFNWKALSRVALTDKNWHKCDNEDVKVWINPDNTEPEHQIAQDSKIVKHTTDRTNTASASLPSLKKNKDKNVPTASEAFKCLETALRWFEVQDESDQHQISILKEVRELAARKQAGWLRQTKITEFFKS